MAKGDTHISVDISVESIRDSLRKMIVSEHSKLITNVIIDHLNTRDIGLHQLFKAMSGIQDTFKFKVGDFVMANPSHLYSWKISIPEMTEAGMIFQGKVKAQIVSINPLDKSPYELKYEVIKNGIKEFVTSSVGDVSIHPEDAWPGDDLPF